MYPELLKGNIEEKLKVIMEDDYGVYNCEREALLCLISLTSSLMPPLRIRGRAGRRNVHTLIIGDKGTGKSTILRIFHSLAKKIGMNAEFIGGITQAGMFCMVDAQGNLSLGAAWDAKDGLLCCSEFGTLLKASKKEHSMEIMDMMKDFLEEGVVRKRVGTAVRKFDDAWVRQGLTINQGKVEYISCASMVACTTPKDINDFKRLGIIDDIIVDRFVISYRERSREEKRYIMSKLASSIGSFAKESHELKEALSFIFNMQAKGPGVSYVDMSKAKKVISKAIIEAPNGWQSYASMRLIEDAFRLTQCIAILNIGKRRIKLSNEEELSRLVTKQAVVQSLSNSIEFKQRLPEITDSMINEYIAKYGAISIKPIHKLLSYYNNDSRECYILEAEKEDANIAMNLLMEHLGAMGRIVEMSNDQKVQMIIESIPKRGASKREIWQKCRKYFKDWREFENIFRFAYGLGYIYPRHSKGKTVFYVDNSSLES